MNAVGFVLATTISVMPTYCLCTLVWLTHPCPPHTLEHIPHNPPHAPTCSFWVWMQQPSRNWCSVKSMPRSWKHKWPTAVQHSRRGCSHWLNMKYSSCDCGSIRQAAHGRVLPPWHGAVVCVHGALQLLRQRQTSRHISLQRPYSIPTVSL